MSWKELSEKISEAVAEKNISVSEISDYLGIDRKKVEKILNGDFSFDDRAHIREYLKRLSWILDLNFEDIWKEYEESYPDDLSKPNTLEKSSNKFEIFMLTVLILLSVLIALKTMDIKSEPCVIIENKENEKLMVNNIFLEKGESYSTCENAKVYGNKKGVLIKTFGKKNYLVKIENFEVIINGKSEKSRSR